MSWQIYIIIIILLLLDIFCQIFCILTYDGIIEVISNMILFVLFFCKRIESQFNIGISYKQYIRVFKKPPSIDGIVILFLWNMRLTKQYYISTSYPYLSSKLTFSWIKLFSLLNMYYIYMIEVCYLLQILIYEFIIMLKKMYCA